MRANKQKGTNYEELVYDVYKNDRAVYDKAMDVLKELGLSGLYRDVYKNIWVIIKTIKGR